jgi:hypothetical protein
MAVENSELHLLAAMAALLSSDDYGWSVERDGRRHPLWRAAEVGDLVGAEWWATTGAAVKGVLQLVVRLGAVGRGEPAARDAASAVPGST